MCIVSAQSSMRFSYVTFESIFLVISEVFSATETNSENTCVFVDSSFEQTHLLEGLGTSEREIQDFKHRVRAPPVPEPRITRFGPLCDQRGGRAAVELCQT